MKIKFLFVLTSLLLLSGCYNSRESLGRYNLPVSDIKEPTKEGKSCSKYVFPFYTLYTNSDLSIEKARQEAGITKITAIDQVTHSLFIAVLPAYVETCVIVKGN
jgi:hypothetical protein